MPTCAHFTQVIAISLWRSGSISIVCMNHKQAQQSSWCMYTLHMYILHQQVLDIVIQKSWCWYISASSNIKMSIKAKSVFSTNIIWIIPKVKNQAFTGILTLHQPSPSRTYNTLPVLSMVSFTMTNKMALYCNSGNFSINKYSCMKLLC